MVSKIHYKYIIVGGGVAGAAAIKGIREIDATGSILLASNEPYLPYQRPALSKYLWFSSKTIEDIAIQKQLFYDKNQCVVSLGKQIIAIEPRDKKIIDEDEAEFTYDCLLLATGSVPRKLSIPGSDQEDVYYYRKYDDFLNLSKKLRPGRIVTVIGGGFLGTEMAATFAQKHMRVNLLFPESWPCSRLLPENIGKSLLQKYIDHGVTVINNDKPCALSKMSGYVVTYTSKGKELKSDYIIVGIGSIPLVDLAQSIELNVDNGIVVDQHMQTSDPSIFSAGDAAVVFDKESNTTLRVEHWQNALRQGRIAGRNMAGAKESYVHQQFFFAELFDFSFKVIGEISASQQTVQDWQIEKKQGVIYFLQDEKLTGILLLNRPDQVDAAKALLENKTTLNTGSLIGQL